MLDPSLLEAYQKPSSSFGDASISIDEVSSKPVPLLQPFAPDGGFFLTTWNTSAKELMLENDKKANQTLKEELLKKNLNVIDDYDVSKDGKWR